MDYNPFNQNCSIVYDIPLRMIDYPDYGIVLYSTKRGFIIDRRITRDTLNLIVDRFDCHITTEVVHSEFSSGFKKVYTFKLAEQLTMV